MDQAIKAAQSALGCGEYRRVLQLLEPLAAKLPVTMKLGAEVRLLQATAHQGLGDPERANRVAALLPSAVMWMRRQARALLEALEAPVLQVPADRKVELQLGSMPAGRCGHRSPLAATQNPATAAAAAGGTHPRQLVLLPWRWLCCSG